MLFICNCRSFDHLLNYISNCAFQIYYISIPFIDSLQYMFSVIRRAQQSIMKFIDIGANLTDLMYTGEYNGSKRHDSDLRVCYAF